MTISSEIGISEFIPLSDNQISLNSNRNNTSEDVISNTSHNFIPRLDFSKIQSKILHSNKLLSDSKGNPAVGKLGFELPNQNELLSFTQSRQFSLQVILFIDLLILLFIC